MTYVRLYIEQELVVEIDLPISASTAELREAALVKLDEGEADWETVGNEESFSAEPIESTWERRQREDRQQHDDLQQVARLYHRLARRWAP